MKRLALGILLGVQAWAGAALAGPAFVVSPATVDDKSGSLSVLVGGISEDGATLKPSTVEIEVDGAAGPAPKVAGTFFDLAQNAAEADSAWKSPLAVGLVYLWIRETPTAFSDAILEGLQGFSKRLPARTSAYATVYGRKRQPIPKLKASEIGGYLHDVAYLGGDRPNLADAVALGVKSLAADESPFRVLLVVTDGRDFADPMGEKPADFAVLSGELAKAGVRLFLVSFPPPEADAEQSAKNLADLSGAGAFFRSVEQPMDLQTTLESLGQSVADLRRVEVAVPWSWRTFGGSHKVRLYLTTDGKRRAVELGKIELPAQTGKLLGMGAGLLGILLVPFGLVLVLRMRGRRMPDDENPVLPAVHALIRRGMSARRALLELTRSFPEQVGSLTKVDESVFSDPRYPLLQTRPGRRRFDEIRALLTEESGQSSLIPDELASALADAISGNTPPQKAAETIAARLPDEKWGGFSRLGLEDLAQALRQSGDSYPVLALPRSRGAALKIQDALRSQKGTSMSMAWLVRAAGPGRRGETLRLQSGRAVLGRGAGCELSLGQDAAIADQHAAITETRGEFAIEPMGGPVKVEDQLVSGSRPLNDGETIEVGPGRYIFKCVTSGNLRSWSGARRPQSQA
jgi:hypothetical protein